MARRVITLRFPATCRDCGAALEAGDRARYYGRGRVYGTDCHADTRTPEQRTAANEARRNRRALTLAARGAPAGQVYSALDPYNAYSPDGRKIGSLCGCEDYPCCGH